MADRKSISAVGENEAESAGEEVAAIPLIEERISVAKKQVESGRVRVHVTVQQQEETLIEQLVHDELHIERVPRNVRVTEIPKVRLEGNTTIVPVVEEVVVIEKVLVLVEEIHVSRRSVAEEAQLPVTRRVERASVAIEPDLEQVVE
jgi:uncharacterized protein (TIGR02271 family)